MSESHVKIRIKFRCICNGEVENRDYKFIKIQQDKKKLEQ